MPRTQSTAKHNKILDFLRIAVILDGRIQWLTRGLCREKPLTSTFYVSLWLQRSTNTKSPAAAGWIEEEAGNSQHHRVRGERVTDFNPITLRRGADGGGVGVETSIVSLYPKMRRGIIVWFILDFWQTHFVIDRVMPLSRKSYEYMLTLCQCNTFV